MRLLLLLLFPLVAFSQTQYSEILKGSSTETDTLLTFTGTSADTSAPFVLCGSTSFRADVTTTNDSTSVNCYPIFSDTPYEGYRKRTSPRSFTGPTDYTHTWGLVDSTDFPIIDDNGLQAGQPIPLDGPVLYARIVCKGKNDNEKANATSVKVTITQDCEDR